MFLTLSLPLSGLRVGFATIELVNEETQTLKLKVKFQKYVSEPSFTSEGYYLLTPRHFDLLSPWILESLKEIDLIHSMVPPISSKNNFLFILLVVHSFSLSPFHCCSIKIEIELVFIFLL